MGLYGDDRSDEILLVNGATDGASKTGTFSLSGDIIVTSVSKIVIPKGMTLKAWARQVSGLVPITVNWQFANDGSTFRTLFTDVLPASQAEFSQDFQSRPRAFRSSAGTEAVQVTWAGGNTGGTVSNVAFNLEFTQD